MPDPKEEYQSALEHLSRLNQEKNEQKQKIIENQEQWKKAINRIVATEEGALLIKYLLRHNTLFKTTSSANPYLEPDS